MWLKIFRPTPKMLLYIEVRKTIKGKSWIYNFTRNHQQTKHAIWSTKSVNLA